MNWRRLSLAIVSLLLSYVFWALSSSRLIQPRQLCGDSLSQGLAPPGACSFSPGLWEASVSQQLILVAGIIACWAPCEPLPPACPPLTLAFPTLHPAVVLSISHCLCPSLSSGALCAFWTLPSWPSWDSDIVLDLVAWHCSHWHLCHRARC